MKKVSFQIAILFMTLIYITSCKVDEPVEPTKPSAVVSTKNNTTSSSTPTSNTNTSTSTNSTSNKATPPITNTCYSEMIRPNNIVVAGRIIAGKLVSRYFDVKTDASYTTYLQETTLSGTNLKKYYQGKIENGLELGYTYKNVWEYKTGSDGRLQSTLVLKVVPVIKYCDPFKIIIK